MSRDIDLGAPLSPEDRNYLLDRGAWGDALIARVDASFPPDKEEVAAVLEKRRGELLKAAGMVDAGTSAVLEAKDREIAELKRQLEMAQAGGQQESPAPDYTGWSKAQLEAEIDRVNVEDPDAKLVKGKVVEMVESLTTYFAE